MRKFLRSVGHYLSQICRWSWLDWMSVLCAIGASVAMIALIIKGQPTSKIFGVSGIIFGLAGTCWLATGVLLTKEDEVNITSAAPETVAKALQVASGRVALAMTILVTSVLFQLISVFTG